ncbi:hypothetical protein POF51_22260 [Brevibacillus sp. AG]|uniref:hypothetical protein n=1 Tax=Brevibacillus sp. AG TaxID=3020891 RepID=UPI00232B2FD8|nr:hypothetical protein [Brevibacillus sp. AG]MDC0763452.1 hypothetical protein [Brevibacillus sp. AG]
MSKRLADEIVRDVATRIPIPDRLLEIKDPKQRRDALEAHWLSYGYSDRFEVVRIENGHFIMMRKPQMDT